MDEQFNHYWDNILYEIILSLFKSKPKKKRISTQRMSSQKNIDNLKYLADKIDNSMSEKEVLIEYGISKSEFLKLILWLVQNLESMEYFVSNNPITFHKWREDEKLLFQSLFLENESRFWICRKLEISEVEFILLRNRVIELLFSLMTKKK